MAISNVFHAAHQNAYKNAVSILEADGQFVVNSKTKASKTGAKNIRVAQSTLVSEIPLNTSITSYQFEWLDNKYNTGSTGLFPNEIRLKQQDVLFAFRVGFYLRCTSAGGGGFENILFTFPSGLIAGTGGSTFNKMYGVWTGAKLSITTNGEVITPVVDLGKSLVVPQTQAPVNAISGSMPFDQVDLDNDGWILMEPNPILNGGNDNQWIVSYPSNFSNYGLGTATWHLVMKVEGWLAQNASSIMNNQPMK